MLRQRDQTTKKRRVIILPKNNLQTLIENASLSSKAIAMLFKGEQKYCSPQTPHKKPTILSGVERVFKFFP